MPLCRIIRQRERRTERGVLKRAGAKHNADSAAGSGMISAWQSKNPENQAAVKNQAVD